jgi:hypothetical protein
MKMVYEMSESERNEWEKIRVESERKMWEEYNKREGENYKWFIDGKFRTENEYEIWLDNQIELNGNEEQRKYGVNDNIPWSVSYKLLDKISKGGVF